MKQLNHILLLALMLTTLQAEIKCNKSGTQIEMNQCAYEDYKSADNLLNMAYNELRTLEKEDTPYLKKLKASQKAWLKFRDAEIEAIFACDSNDMQLCWGSMYPLLYNSSMQKLTENRTKTLVSYIDDYTAKNGDIFNPNETQEFLILKSTKSYKEAKAFVKKMSKELNIEIDYRGLSHHKTNFLTFDKKTCEDFGYPCYIGRGRAEREGEYLSIEHSNIYQEMRDGYYVVVAATGTDVSKSLSKVKKVVKDAYVKKLEIYLGCMH